MGLATGNPAFNLRLSTLGEEDLADEEGASFFFVSAAALAGFSAALGCCGARFFASCGLADFASS
jgi:hypothetical protein